MFGPYLLPEPSSTIVVSAAAFLLRLLLKLALSAKSSGPSYTAGLSCSERMSTRTYTLPPAGTVGLLELL